MRKQSRMQSIHSIEEEVNKLETQHGHRGFSGPPTFFKPQFWCVLSITAWSSRNQYLISQTNGSLKEASVKQLIHNEIYFSQINNKQQQVRRSYSCGTFFIFTIKSIELILSPIRDNLQQVVTVFWPHFDSTGSYWWWTAADIKRLMSQSQVSVLVPVPLSLRLFFPHRNDSYARSSVRLSVQQRNVNMLTACPKPRLTATPVCDQPLVFLPRANL